MLNLLHVDDDRDILAVAEMALELSGDFRVVGCLSGEEALEAVKNFVPDVFLLDVMMPDMTGPQTLEKLREIPSLKDVPAVFLTARVSVESNEELLRLGAARVIAKPFDSMTLGMQIKEALS